MSPFWIELVSGSKPSKLGASVVKMSMSPKQEISDSVFSVRIEFPSFQEYQLHVFLPFFLGHLHFAASANGSRPSGNSKFVESYLGFSNRKNLYFSTRQPPANGNCVMRLTYEILYNNFNRILYT